MANWQYTVDIKKFITEDASAEAIKKCYESINEALKAVPFVLPLKWHEYTKLAIEQDDDTIFNDALDALYDWADKHRIWLGMM